MSAHTEPLLHYLRRLTTRSANDSSDAVLVERFVSQRDESAFATLLARHGPMVLGVCRRLLRESHDAEDAFQATFLVLARKAGSLRRPERLAAWLYGTAHHLASTIRRGESRRQQHEARCLESVASASPRHVLDDLSARELLLALDEELARMPEVYRLPLILCHLEGHTLEEAARLLGWTTGSIKGRLERGRERLRVRLSRRGLTLSVSLLALGSMASLTIAATLRQATIQKALAFAAGSVEDIAARVLSLAEAGIPSMTASKAKWAAFMLLALSLVGGTGALAFTLEDKLSPQKIEQPEAESQKQKGEAINAEKSGPARTDLYGDPLPPGAIARMGTMRFRHLGDVTFLAYSADGKMIASGEANQGPIVLWDAATGRELRRIEIEAGVLGGFAFSPDSKHLALVKWGSWVGFWDVATGKQVRRKEVRPLPGGCLAFSPDGKLLAVPAGDSVVHLYDERGRQRQQLRNHPERIISVAFSADGKTLAAGGDGKSICLWDVETGKQLHLLRGHEKQVPFVTFSADGKTLASASHDRTVRLWDTATGQEQRRFTHFERDDDAIQTVHFVPRHPWLVTGSMRSIRIWDLTTGKEVRRFPGHFCLCGCPVALSPDGTKLVTRGGEQGQVILWELATGKRLCPPVGHLRAIGSVAFSPDGKTLASGSWDETLRLWDTATGKELRRFPPLGFSVHVAYTPDGKLLAGISADGFIRFWDAATSKELRCFRLHKTGVESFALAPDGKTFVSTQMNWMVFAADGKTMVPKETPDKTIHLWRADTGKEIGRFEGHQEVPHTVAFAPDGRTIVSVSEDKTLRLWDVASRKEVRQFRGHQGSLHSVVYSPDGKTLAAGEGKEMLLWDIATGEEVRRFVGHQDTVQSVRFSPDGRMLASAGSDRTVRLWEVATGQERKVFHGHRYSVFALAFFGDGRRLASGGYDANILIWDVTGLIAGQREGADSLSNEELAKLWTKLGEEKNASEAFAAMCRLLRAPRGTVRLFRKHLLPVPAFEEGRIARWIADLDSAEFSVRERAMRELEKHGDAVEDALRKVLERRPSLEARQRVKLLLEKLSGATRLRKLRAVEVLENFDIAESRQLLETLATGAAEARLTQEAKAALARRTAQHTVQP